MAIGRFVGPEDNHIAGFRDELEVLANQDVDAFFTFFNSGADYRQAMVTGAWDFSIHIAGPLNGLLAETHTKTVMEVGYGGGRILASAARHFGHAVGVDIHHKSALVHQRLAESGVENITLHEGDGTTYPVLDAAIDVAYSFIVFQHMERLDILKANLAEIHRVLRPGGIALLYFGRVSTLANMRRSRLLALVDRLRDDWGGAPAYRELPARVNESNLRVSSRLARRLLTGLGFTVLRSGFSCRRPPDGGDRYGAQHWLAVRKR